MYIVVFTISTHAFAQCYTTAPCTGGSALPSYSVTTGTPTWTGGTYKVGNNNLTVSGSSTVLTISNSCIEFDYATSTIGVTSGAHLILDNCILYSSSSALWQGVKVNSGSWVTTSNGTIIADAVKGVWSNSGANEAKFTISGTTFCHCKYGVFMSPFSSTSMTSTVTGSTFSGGSLHGGGNSIAGIYLKEIGTPSLIFTIGSLGVYGTSTNNFTGGNYGIQSEDSYLYVQDGNFHDLNNSFTTGYGIFSKNLSGSDDVLKVGTYSSSGANNYFNNCYLGINVDGNVQTYVYENNFTSSYSSGYTMDKAIKIASSESIVDIKDNSINNYQEHGVWLKDVTDDYANIFNNTFNLTSGFSSSSTAMAIRVFETTMIDNLILEIYDNLINAGRTGIFIQGIESLYGTDEAIHDNEIYFSYPGSGANAYGIRVIECCTTRVKSNYCEGNGTGTDDIVRGISFEDTQWFNCFYNHVNICDVGIYCNADVSLSLINCNMIEDCPYAGMFFNNIGGPSTTILYPNMTATGAPSGNYWLPDPTANRGASNGSTDFLYSTWNYSDDDGSEYGMPTSCFVGVTNPLYPTNIHEDNECADIPYARTSGGEETDALLEELMNAYSQYADAFSYYYPDGSLNDYYTLSSFWVNVTANELDADALPDNLKHLYNFISETNIPEIVELSHAISAKDYAAANALVEIMVAANDIEYYILRTSELYLGNLNGEGIFELNDEILPEIRSIALLNGWDYGRGVYAARAMMDTVIEFNMPEDVEKLGILPEQKIVVYPNPASHYITLNYPGNKPVADIYSIGVYNLLGRVVKEFSLTTNTIDVSSIPNGVYFIKITLLRGEQFISKLEILNK